MEDEVPMTDLVTRSELSFIDRCGRDRKHFWKPERTDDWSADNRRGHAYADELVRYMRDQEDPAMLGRIVKDMREAQWSGVEVGFLQRISEHAL